MPIANFAACLTLIRIHITSSSVRIAWVLLVFSYLVVPAVCAMFFVKNVKPRLLIGWGFGFAASVLGLYASAKWDLPTGASVIVAFGTILIICAIIKFFTKTEQIHPQ